MKLPTLYNNLSWQERIKVREQYIEEQDGLCYWCDCDLYSPPPKRITSVKINWSRFPPNFLKHPIHLQHCHKSGLTEGAVHAYCNALMFDKYGR